MKLVDALFLFSAKITSDSGLNVRQAQILKIYLGLEPTSILTVALHLDLCYTMAIRMLRFAYPTAVYRWLAHDVMSAMLVELTQENIINFYCGWHQHDRRIIVF